MVSAPWVLLGPPGCALVHGAAPHSESTPLTCSATRKVSPVARRSSASMWQRHEPVQSPHSRNALKDVILDKFLFKGHFKVSPVRET